jgi:hypothetical protein
MHYACIHDILATEFNGTLLMGESVSIRVSERGALDSSVFVILLTGRLTE